MPDTNHAPEDSPELESQLDAAVRSVLAQPLDAGAIARVKARATLLLTESPIESKPLASTETAVRVASSVREVHPNHANKRSTSIFSRSLVMKCLSAAAAIVVVVTGTLLLQPSRSAFADVINQLRDARSFSYVQKIYTEGNTKPIVVKTLVSEDGRQRQEHSAGTITIMDKNSRIRLTLITATKTALVYDPGDAEKKFTPNHPLEWMEHLKAHGDKPDEQLGKKELDGHSVEGFVVKQGEAAYTVWVDTKSKQLFQIEWEMPVKGSTITKIVRTDFRFNEKLDDSLFSFDVPEGYTVRKQKALPTTGLGGEKSIVEALRGFTKQSDGKFPKSISEWGEWAILFSRGSKDGQLSEDSRATLGHLGSIMPFLSGMKKDNYEYLGAGKSLEDKKCIVFWYRTKEGNLRAIYNDFTTADLQEKDLP